MSESRAVHRDGGTAGGAATVRCRIAAAMCLLLLPLAAAAQAPVGEEALLAWWQEHGVPPVDYVVSKFDSHDWVFLGEYHRVREDLLLVRDLIPALHARTRVRHLALEMLCRERTEEANRLIAAETFDRGEAIDFFRSQFPDWSHEEYLDLYRTAWESNRVHAAERGPLRFVGLHPCIDYEVVHYSGDEAAVRRELAKRDEYDRFMAAALEELVLEPGRPALVFTGIAHATAKFPEYWYDRDEQLPRMGNLAYREPWKRRMFFVALHAPFWDAGRGADVYPFDGVLDRLMRRHRAPIGFDVVGTPFAGLAHAQRSPRAITAFTFGELYDGYVMHPVPLAETVGTTCIPDWIETAAEYRHYWRHLGNEAASKALASVPFEDFRRRRCAPSPDHGLLFRKRFAKLPDPGAAEPAPPAGDPP